MSASHIPAAPRRRGPFISTLAAVAAALAATFGAAPSAGAQTVFHACYVPASGTVYRIKAPSTPQNCLQPTHVAFSWTDGAGGGGGGGVSSHGALTGLGDDDHTQYLLNNGVRSSASGFAVTAPLGGGASLLTRPDQDNGNFAFIAGKGALRLGGVGLIDEWALNNVGVNSVAFGRGAYASASGSYAFGDDTRATEVSAVAIGHGAAARHSYSIALGLGASSEGFRSIAISGGRALGDNSLAFNGTAEGERSFAFGSNANGSRAIALNGAATGADALSILGIAQGNRAIAIGRRALADKVGSVVIATSTNNNAGTVKPAVDGQFVVSAPHIFLGHLAQPNANADRFIETGTGAYLSSGGTWSNSSDSTKKTDFHAVDGEQVLSKLAALPVYTWRYTAEDSAVRHMGPTAQAFRKAFGLGDTDKAIATVDIDGVAVAGVKALEARTKQLKVETQALRAENAELAERLAQLESLVARLTQTSKER